jgi:hypothetical protein
VEFESSSREFVDAVLSESNISDEIVSASRLFISKGVKPGESTSEIICSSTARMEVEFNT